MTEKVFKAEIRELPEMIAFLEAQLEQLDCPMKDQLKIQLSAEELFVNVASYAYEGKDGTVAFEIGPDPETAGVLIRISDFGIPFNPLARPDPDITLKAEERRIGGLGIWTVKKNMDKVDYEYTDNKNIVTIRKHFT